MPDQPRHARVRDDARARARGRWARAARRRGSTPSSRARSARGVRTRDDPARHRHRRSRACAAAGATPVCSISDSTSSPSRNRITISATIASCRDEARLGVEVEHAQARPCRARTRRSRTAPSATGTSGARCPDSERAAHEQAPEYDTGRRRRSARADRVPHEEATMCASPCWASRPPGRTPAERAAAISIEEGEIAVLLDCGNGVFGKLRRYRDYVDVDAVVISHLHADHFLDLVPFTYALTYAPRQQPVPVDRWPGTDSPAAPEAARADRRARDVPPRRRRLGQRGPHRERLRPAASTSPPTPSRSGRCGSPSPRSRTSCRPARSP